MSKKKKKKKAKSSAAPPQGGSRTLYQLGLKHFHRGDYSEAIRVWRHLKPSHAMLVRLAEAHFRHALSFYPDNRIPQVISELHQAIQCCPDKAVYQFHLGLAYHRKGNLDKAIPWYQKATECDPQNTRLVRHLVLAYLEAGEPQKAEALLHAAQSDNGAFSEMARISILWNTQGPEAVLKHLQHMGQNGAPPQFQALQGLILLTMEKTKEAKPILRNTARAASEDPWVGYYLGVAYATDGNLPSAAKAWEQALQNDLPPRLVDTELVHVYHQLATRYVEQGNLSKAIECWKKILDRRPQDGIARDNLVRAYFLRGDDHARNNRLPLAIRWWEHGIELDPTNLDVLHNLALAYDRMDNLEKSNPYWTRVVAEWKKAQRSDKTLRGALNVAHRHLGDNYLKTDQPEQAISEYRKAIHYNPDDVDTLIQLGQLLLAEESTVAAIRELERARQLAPENPDLLNALGSAYCGQSSCNRAMACWKEVLQFDPHNAVAGEHITRCVMEQVEEKWRWEDPDTVTASIREVIRLQPGRIKLYVALGRLYLQGGQTEKAAEVFREAIGAHPDKPDAYVAIGHTYLMEDMEEDAAAHFESAMARSPDDTGLLTVIGDSYCHAGRVKTARSYFRRALDTDPTDPRIPLQIGSMLLESGFHDQAMTYLRKALQLAPYSPDVHFFLAFAYYQDHNYTEASKAADRARNLARETGNRALIEAIERLQMSIAFARSPLGRLGLL